MDVPRTRSVGLAVQHLCYEIVIDVPASAPLDDAELKAMFMAFRFR